MFFKSMPTMRYKIDNKPRIVTDIFKRVAFSKFQNSKLALDEYYVRDRETPEGVAYDFYGSSTYHWVILLANNIVDVHKEWPRPQNSLFEYVEDKYGVNNASEVHHYLLKKDVNGNDVTEEIYVDYNASDLATGKIESVTNYKYEEELNDDKRQIYLLKPQYVEDVIVSYKRLMAG